MKAPLSERLLITRKIPRSPAGSGLAHAVGVAVGDYDLGVVQEPKARRFVDSWLPAMRDPNVVVALGSGAGRVRVKSPRSAFGMGRGLPRVFRTGGLLGKLTKMVVEGALEGELDDHLGYGKHDPAGRDGGNSRNGRRGKTVITDTGPVEISVPRDRDASFEPKIVAKRQQWLTGYSRGEPRVARGLPAVRRRREGLRAAARPAR